MVVGTAGYMSPEQVRGEAVDARSDLFSFGTMLYEMLTGRPAFTRDTAAETMAAILKEDPPSRSRRTFRRRSRGSSRAAWRKRARRGFSRRAIWRSRWSAVGHRRDAGSRPCGAATLDGDARRRAGVAGDPRGRRPGGCADTTPSFETLFASATFTPVTNSRGH